MKHVSEVLAEVGQAVVIRLPKVTYVLTVAELTRLLATDRDLWVRAIKRGKMHCRGEATARRVAR